MVFFCGWFVKFRTGSAKHKFLSWFSILSKALNNESICDEELVRFFKLKHDSDLVKARANFEGMIKNYYLLGFKPFFISLKKEDDLEEEFLFVMRYNFLFNLSFLIKFVLKNVNFKSIKKDLVLRRIKNKDLFELYLLDKN